MKEMTEPELLSVLEQGIPLGKWKAYEGYKDSGIEGLGEIPEYWEVRRLKHASFINSETLPENISSDYILQYIDIGNVNAEGEIGEVQELTFKNAPSRARRIVRNGDTILSTVRTYLRAIGYISESSSNLVVSTGFAVLRPYGVLNSKFLFRYVQSHEFVNIVVSYSEGVSYPAISPSHLVCLKLLLPSLPEQQSIVAFLDHETTRINDLIAKKERMIELLQERRTAIINQAITKGLNLDVPMKDSGVEWLGEIPEHWEVRKIKHIIAILRGKFSYRPRNEPRLYDGQYPFIQTGDITSANKYINSYQQTLNELGYKVSKEFPSQTLVMAIAANVGDVAILQFSACFPDSIVGFFPYHDTFLDYIYYSFLTMKQEMLSTATINTQLNLNIERVGNLCTVYPPLKEQKEIAAYLDQETAKIDKLVSVIEEAIKKLKEYNTALISAAVTGKIDVRGEVADTHAIEETAL